MACLSQLEQGEFGGLGMGILPCLTLSCRFSLETLGKVA